MSSALDESGDKILLLENLLNERDSKLADLANEINQLRDSSSWLTSELESMINLNEKLAQADVQDDTRLSQLDSDSQSKRSQLVEQLKELRLRSRSRIKASELMLIGKRSKNELQVQRRPSSGQNSARLARASRRGLRTRRIGRPSDSSHNVSPDSNGYSQDEWEDSSVDEGGLVELEPDIVAEIFVLLGNFASDLQQRKESLNSQHQQQISQSPAATAVANGSITNANTAASNLYNSQNSSCAEDSGISTDESKLNFLLSQIISVNIEHDSSVRCVKYVPTLFSHRVGPFV